MPNSNATFNINVYIFRTASQSLLSKNDNKITTTDMQIKVRNATFHQFRQKSSIGRFAVYKQLENSTFGAIKLLPVTLT